jgi:hypothetical protein
MMRALLLVVLVASMAACSKSPEQMETEAKRVPAGDNAPRITPERVTQGLELCLGYSARVCKCADKDPSYKEECTLAQGRPEGLKVVVKFLGGSSGPMSTRERLEQEAGAEKIIAACVRADSALDPAKCPRY